MATVAKAQDAAAAVPPQAASLAVTPDPARRETLMRTISGSGLVTAWEEITIGASASGLALTEILVSEGQRIVAGDVVARLDDKLLQAEIAEQQAMIQSAEASHAAAISAAERGRRLSASGSVSSETLEERETTVKTTAAALAQAKAALDTLKVQADRTVVRAPVAGIVAAKPATLGIIVQTGTELLRLQRDGALRASIDVPEQHLFALVEGATAEVFGPAGDRIEGTIALVGETVDAATHLGRVEIALPDGSGLRAGMFVRATIRVEAGEALTVPTAALTWRDGRTAVFVVEEDNAVRLATVATGERTDERIAVAGDLAEGDRVVTAGAGFLSDGETVRLVTRSTEVETAE